MVSIQVSKDNVRVKRKRVRSATNLELFKHVQNLSDEFRVFYSDSVVVGMDSCKVIDGAIP